MIYFIFTGLRNLWYFFAVNTPSYNFRSAQIMCRATNSLQGRQTVYKPFSVGGRQMWLYWRVGWHWMVIFTSNCSINPSTNMLGSPFRWLHFQANGNWLRMMFSIYGLSMTNRECFSSVVAVCTVKFGFTLFSKYIFKTVKMFCGSF